ncbi:hypothetical protein BC829DRAFT_33435 [Chytridium lagenaria]|nr:hypothetical protein BC829DRAFT_33435 [Chytridium lagenaria]
MVMLRPKTLDNTRGRRGGGFVEEEAPPGYEGVGRSERVGRSSKHREQSVRRVGSTSDMMERRIVAPPPSPSPPPSYNAALLSGDAIPRNLGDAQEMPVREVPTMGTAVVDEQDRVPRCFSTLPSTRTSEGPGRWIRKYRSLPQLRGGDVTPLQQDTDRAGENQRTIERAKASPTGFVAKLLRHRRSFFGLKKEDTVDKDIPVQGQRRASSSSSTSSDSSPQSINSPSPPPTPQTPKVPEFRILFPRTLLGPSSTVPIIALITSLPEGRTITNIEASLVARLVVEEEDVGRRKRKTVDKRVLATTRMEVGKGRTNLAVRVPGKEEMGEFGGGVEAPGLTLSHYIKMNSLSAIRTRWVYPRRRRMYLEECPCRFFVTDILYVRAAFKCFNIFFLNIFLSRCFSCHLFNIFIVSFLLRDLTHFLFLFCFCA